MDEDEIRSPNELREQDPSDTSHWNIAPEIIQKACREIIDSIIAKPNITKEQITPLKCKIQKKYNIPHMIKDSVLLRYASAEERDSLGPILRRRFTRTISGVIIVAVMTKPLPCPGKCIYCPGPASQPGKKVAQSYTGREPAAMRSIMYNYDPYEQTFHRLLDQYKIGHQIDKIDLIIMGGTFLSAPDEYQFEFMKGCFDAILNFGQLNYNEHKRTPDFETSKKLLETATIKLIGVTFETRPDYCTERYVDRILELGGTRIELGVQTTRDDVLEFVQRGHRVEQSINAIRIAKDGGLKVNTHIMPNLPLSTPESDLEMFRQLFNDSQFRPDMLKIYPTLVIGGTRLHELYQQHQYQPYPQEEVVKVIAQIKTELPPYVRIQRIQRDIPVNLIIDGVKNSNLRQLVQIELKQRNAHCNCIRCREEGFFAHNLHSKISSIDFSKVKLLHYEYDASNGKEIFFSLEDPEQSFLIGYLRLRIPSSNAHRPEIKSSPTAIIREIRVVGELVKANENPGIRQIQHRGYGKILMEAGENWAKKVGCHKMVVISGIGARPYFYNLGYSIDGPYVSKSIDL